jgi:hypothetical protein
MESMKRSDCNAWSIPIEGLVLARVFRIFLALFVLKTVHSGLFNKKILARVCFDYRCWFHSTPASL